MLRITTATAGNEMVIKLEGWLSGPWVREAEATWREAAGGPVKRVRVDLVDVCDVDAAGRELMARMYHAGVQLVAGGCLMREVVREISESPDGPQAASGGRRQAC